MDITQMLMSVNLKYVDLGLNVTILMVDIIANANQDTRKFHRIYKTAPMNVSI